MSPTGGPFPPPPFPAGDTGAENVSFIMPLADGTRSIVLTHNGTVLEVLDTRDVSLNAPQVHITSPVQAVEWQAHTTQPLTWTGSDLDGDPLNYSVLLQQRWWDQSFILLADNLTATSYNIDVDSMAGGSDVRFRVVASDGVNTGFDETPATITIPNHPPVAIITDPNGSSIPSSRRPDRLPRHRHRYGRWHPARRIAGVERQYPGRSRHRPDRADQQPRPPASTPSP